MNFENVEYWVLKSMEEARVALQNGEVPVGCLFIIHKEILESLNMKSVQSNDAKQSEDQVMSKDVPGNSLEMEKKLVELNENEVSEAPPPVQIPPTVEDESGGYIVIARGKNEVNATKNATRHAEMVCIDQIVDLYTANYSSVFENLTVIVNVEPCIMCMAALLDLNVRTIVFTCVNDRFGYKILGNDERTNYVEIVEEMIGEDKLLVSADNEELVGQLSQNVEIIDDEDDSIMKERLETNLKNRDRKKTKIDVNIVQEPPDHIQYRISFKNKNLCANKNQRILSKISALLEDSRKNLCHVFHYRKYESETMNILKLFYKGVNPNAPKNKVKIKS